MVRKETRNYNIEIYKNEELTKEILDSIKVGDRISQETKYMKVVGVSENFIFATQNLFGEVYYAVFDKNPSEGSHNAVWYPNCRIKGKYYCAPMGLIGGESYEEYDTPEGVQKNLEALESGKVETSWRRAYTYYELTIARKKGSKAKNEKN